MRQPKPTHEKRKPQLSPNNSYEVRINHTHIKGICIFTKFKMGVKRIYVTYEKKKSRTSD